MRHLHPANFSADLSALLDNYRTLVARVDTMCDRINSAFSAQITCRPGCSGCCRHLSLFPVEALALAQAAAQLPAAVRLILLARAGRQDQADRCPFLDQDRCLVYDARPIICRTHGLPLLILADGSKRIDFCPENFQGVATLSGQDVINLELLNQSLAAINALFIKEAALEPLAGERITLAEILQQLLPETD
jgi:Fe-S-cluster containining protein